MRRPPALNRPNCARFFDPSPEQQVIVLVETGTLRQAES